MNIKLFNSPYAESIKKAIQSQEKQHKAIAQNVAHASDPNYKRIETDFSHILNTEKKNSTLNTTNQKHISHLKGSSGKAGGSAAGTNDEVDLSREMMDLAENQIRYDFSTRVLNRYYNGISISISGRPR